MYNERVNETLEKAIEYLKKQIENNKIKNDKKVFSRTIKNYKKR